MTDDFKYPKGAIQSVDQVQFGRRLWNVCKSNGCRLIEEVTVARGAVVGEIFYEYCYDPGGFWVEFRYPSGSIGVSSLRDANIGAHYNNNFLFATEEDAWAFLEDKP